METTSVQMSGKFLTFKLGAEFYGVEIGKVHEIIKPPPVTRVPHQPPFLRGVINLRGRIIPVIDLRLRFGLEAREFDDLTCVVVMQVGVDKERTDMGIIVDEVQEVLEISDEQLVPPPEFGTEMDTGFMTGMAKLNDRVVMLLNAEKTLTVMAE